MSETFNAELWDSSQYETREQAEKFGGVRTWDTTYGISATLDAVCNTVKIARMLSEDAPREIRIQWEIDGETLPECNLAESMGVLSAIERGEVE